MIGLSESQLKSLIERQVRSGLQYRTVTASDLEELASGVAKAISENNRVIELHLHDKSR
jgi:hypothetical protein